jgi:hypothetical protein
VSWDLIFFDPIEVPRGRPLVSLRDAGRYISGLPASQQRLAPWQTAAELLLLVAGRGGDTMMARIAMMQALNHGRPPPAIAPRRKRARVFKVVR